MMCAKSPSVSTARSSMREGALLVDHTTTSEAPKSLAASADQSGVAFLDAPVSGGKSVRKMAH